MHRSSWKEFGKVGARPERIVWAVAEYEGQRSICPLRRWYSVQQR